MRMLLITLPVAVLFLAFLFGMARISRAFTLFACWTLLCLAAWSGSIAYGIAYSQPEVTLAAVAIAICLSVPSFWLATLFSIATNPKISPAPVQQIYAAYEGLDPAEQERVRLIARTGLRFATECVASHLATKGSLTSAQALSNAAKHI